MKPKSKNAKPAATPGPPLPPNVAVALTSKDITAALRIGSRKFAEMLSSGKYPRPDFKIGTLNRWRVETHNAWVARQGTGTGQGGSAQPGARNPQDQ